MGYTAKNRRETPDKFVIGGELAVEGGKITKDGEEVDLGGGDVDLSKYYTKTEADGKFQPKGTYATKAQIDALAERVKALEDAGGGS